MIGKPADVKVWLVNNTLHYKFSKVEFELCGKKSLMQRDSILQCLLETHLNYEKEAKKHQVQSMLWYRDTSWHMEGDTTSN